MKWNWKEIARRFWRAKRARTASHGIRLTCRCEACVSIRRDMADANRYRTFQERSKATPPSGWTLEAKLGQTRAVGPWRYSLDEARQDATVGHADGTSTESPEKP